MVPGAGIEPAWSFKLRGILSPLRLPISPPGLCRLIISRFALRATQDSRFARILSHSSCRQHMYSNTYAAHLRAKRKAGAGIEPAYTALQAAA